MEIDKFREALKSVEGYVGTDVVESHGSQHVVLATTQPASVFCDGSTPSCDQIMKFAEACHIRASVLPFDTEHGVSYDIVMR